MKNSNEYNISITLFNYCVKINKHLDQVLNKYIRLKKSCCKNISLIWL